MAALIALPAPADSLGGRLRQARGYLGLKQDELAARVGVSRETIGNWERSVTHLTVSDLLSVAKATGFPAAWFVEGLEGAGPTVDDDGPGTHEYAPRDSNPEPADSRPDVHSLPIFRPEIVPSGRAA